MRRPKDGVYILNSNPSYEFGVVLDHFGKNLEPSPNFSIGNPLLTPRILAFVVDGTLDSLFLFCLHLRIDFLEKVEFSYSKTILQEFLLPGGLLDESLFYEDLTPTCSTHFVKLLDFDGDCIEIRAEMFQDGTDT